MQLVLKGLKEKPDLKDHRDLKETLVLRAFKGLREIKAYKDYRDLRETLELRAPKA